VVDRVDGTVSEQWWQPVELSGAALTVLPMTLMAVRGTTLAYYRASAHGRATLASPRPAVCAAAAGRGDLPGVRDLVGGRRRALTPQQLTPRNVSG
jgi:hypothetical protein